MKKNNKKILILGFVFLLVIVLICLAFVFLFSKDKNSGLKSKNFTIVNNNEGFKATFFYDDKDKFEKFKENKDADTGEFIDYSFENSELFLNFNIHYDLMLLDTYNELKVSGKASSYYKEYKSGQYNIYIASEDEDYASGYIFLSEKVFGDTKMANVIYFSIYNASEREKDDFYKALDDKRIKKLLESVNIKKIKVNNSKENEKDSSK